MIRKALKDPVRSLFISVAVSLTLGVASLYTTALFSRRAHAQEQPVVKPVTISYTFQMYGPGGELFMTKSLLYMRFRDGSQSKTSAELTPKAMPLITEILNATTGDWIYLDPITRSSITFKRSPIKVRSVIEQDDDGVPCPAGVDLAKLPQLAPMLGQPIVYYDDKDRFGDMVERWMAPDLNCLPIKEIDTSSRHHGSYNVKIATSIKIGEPNEELKSAPRDYTERFPEAIESMHVAETGGQTFFGTVVLKAMKRQYAKDGALAKE